MGQAHLRVAGDAIPDDIGRPDGGVPRQDADLLGAWWEDRRQIIQPSAFVLGLDNKVLASRYSDGPLRRVDVADVLAIAKFVADRSK
ncbi:MAG: hypothetical protein R3D67_12850 [Hyphomicrobiaceae bacterium]